MSDRRRQDLFVFGLGLFFAGQLVDVLLGPVDHRAVAIAYVMGGITSWALRQVR